jgi:hypothetical protein
MNEMLISKPMPIKIKEEQQSSLLKTRFVPPQNSPPSLWKIRLNKRVGDSPIKKSVNKA